MTKNQTGSQAEVPGIDEQTFLWQAETTEKNCPISQVLGGTEIKLQARLVKAAG